MATDDLLTDEEVCGIAGIPSAVYTSLTEGEIRPSHLVRWNIRQVEIAQRRWPGVNWEQVVECLRHRSRGANLHVPRFLDGIPHETASELERAGLHVPSRHLMITPGESEIAKRRWPSLDWERLLENARAMSGGAAAPDDSGQPTPDECLADLPSTNWMHEAGIDPATASQLRGIGMHCPYRIREWSPAEQHLAKRRWGHVDWDGVSDHLEANLPPKPPRISPVDNLVEEPVEDLLERGLADRIVILQLRKAGVESINRIRSWSDQEIAVASRRWQHVNWLAVCLAPCR